LQQAKNLTPSRQLLRGWIGIGGNEVPAKSRESLGLAAGGVLITTIDKTSPAQRAGLQLGDVVTHLGDEAVESPTHLFWTLRRKALGDTVKLSLLREGSARAVTVPVEWTPRQ
jgi:S1-C subfamily serine protease